MIEKKINISSSKSFFEVLNNYLKNGFIIIDSPFLCLKLKKDEEIVILNFNNLSAKECTVLCPSFNNTQMNLVAGIIKNYGGISNLEIDNKIFDKKYKNTIILLLDGMGMNILENFNKLYPNNFLSKNFYKKVNSIYPSTTAASTTSIKTCKVPLETGWTGWNNWIREIDRNVILFNGDDYYSSDKGFINGFNIMPYKYYFSNLNVLGGIVEPEFKNKDYTFKDTLDRSLKNISNGIVTQYVYDETPDKELHVFGTNCEDIYKKLYNYSCQIEEFYNKLPLDTLLIITADHGHIDTIDFNLFDDFILNGMLERKPSNDTRCLTFKVKKEYMERFSRYFNSVYGKIYKLIDSKEAIRLGYFGQTDNISNRIDDFLADYVALATSNIYLCTTEKALGKKSNHAGITKEEMEVPVFILRK